MQNIGTLLLSLIIILITCIICQQDNTITKLWSAINNIKHESPSVGIVCDPYYKTIPEAVLRKNK